MSELLHTNPKQTELSVLPAPESLIRFEDPVVITLSDANLSDLDTQRITDLLTQKLKSRGDIRTFMTLPGAEETESSSGVSFRAKLILQDGERSLQLFCKRIAERHLLGDDIYRFDGEAPGMADELSVLERTKPVIGLPHLVARINDEQGRCVAVVKGYFEGDTVMDLVNNGKLDKDAALEIYMKAYDQLAAQGWYIWDENLSNLVVRQEITQPGVWLFGFPDTGAGLDFPFHGTPEENRAQIKSNVSENLDELISKRDTKQEEGTYLLVADPTAVD